MKRITTFTVSYPNQSRKIYGLLLSVLTLLMIISSPTPTNAQSKDRDNPTLLTSNEISGVVDSDTRGSIFYYSFTAGPGEVSITLTVEPGGRLNDSDHSYPAVGVHLFDRNAELIASKQVAPIGAGAGQAVARADITRRQPVVLQIVIGGMDGRGRYRVRINGAVEISPAATSPDELRPVTGTGPGRALTDDDVDRYWEFREVKRHMPKRGTLLIKLKDGSVRRIDLGQVNEIDYEP